MSRTLKYILFNSTRGEIEYQFDTEEEANAALEVEMIATPSEVFYVMKALRSGIGKPTITPEITEIE